MKLASLKTGGRDGSLIIVDRSVERFVPAAQIVSTMQVALDDWQNLAPLLQKISDELNAGLRDDAQTLDPMALASPLPRAYEFVDGSAYLPH